MVATGGWERITALRCLLSCCLEETAGDGGLRAMIVAGCPRSAGIMRLLWCGKFRQRQFRSRIRVGLRNRLVRDRLARSEPNSSPALLFLPFCRWQEIVEYAITYSDGSPSRIAIHASTKTEVTSWCWDRSALFSNRASSSAQ
jgi:hypothetical protein